MFAIHLISVHNVHVQIFCYLLDLPEINSVVTFSKPIRALNNPKIYMLRMCIPVPKRTQKEEHSNVMSLYFDP